jgi:hypothetical protein
VCKAAVHSFRNVFILRGVSVAVWWGNEELIVMLWRYDETGALKLLNTELQI